MSEDDLVDTEEEDLRRVDVELLIVHPKLTADDITSALGLKPSHSRSVDTPRTTLKGAKLGGLYKDTRWRYVKRHEIREQWFVDELESFIEALVPHKDFLHKVRASGGSIAVIIQFFRDGYLGDSITLETLAKLIELKLDLSIECY